VLVDHVWSRGVSRERARLTSGRASWPPATSCAGGLTNFPSGLRSFALGTGASSAITIERLRDPAKMGRLTIVYAARGQEHNNAAVLAELLGDGWCMAAVRAARIGGPMSFEEPYQAHAVTQCTPATPELWLRPVGGPLK
jgi:uncharacterized protein YeaO (DUF488 family)